MSVDEGMDSEDVVYIQWNISHEKNEIQYHMQQHECI